MKGPATGEITQHPPTLFHLWAPNDDVFVNSSVHPFRSHN